MRQYSYSGEKFIFAYLKSTHLKESFDTKHSGFTRD